MIFNKLLEIFERTMPQVRKEEIKMDSVLTTDLGVDSLNMMLLAISVEDTFGIQFEPGAKLETVSDICNYVEEKTAA
ncbi:MAG: acyl carrier protein [Lachnospiraceae bacterium]|nr:acyl carrier protein [Lachnospiraceae bacterium]